MGLMQKRDDEDREYIEGVEIIERSDVPDDDGTEAVDVVAAGAAPADDGAAAAEVEAGEAEGADAGDVDNADADADATTVLNEAADDADDADGASRISVPRHEGGPHKAILIACAVVAVVVAAILGYFVGSGGFSPEGRGLSSSTLTDDELDTVVASYSYNGATHDITAREALESEYSLDSIKGDDGTYAAPTASMVLAYVRNQVLLADAASRGIEVSDDEMASFAESSLGTSDYADISSSYGVTEDQAKDIVRQSATIEKLYEQIVPDAATTVAPTQPTAPADGAEDTPTADYAAYIINLLGDEWDASANTWARTDGDFYAALGDGFSPDAATYGQAMTAYYVAYQNYSDVANEASSTWTSYANGLYAGVDLTVYGLYQ